MGNRFSDGCWGCFWPLVINIIIIILCLVTGIGKYF